MTFKTYKIKSITFDAAPIISLQNVNFSGSGNSFDIQGDGNVTIEDVFVDSVGYDITADVADIDEINGIAIGDAGATVIVFEERASSTGSTAGPDLTATIANSRVTAINFDGPSSGAGGGSISIRGAGPNDSAIVVWS